MKLTVLALIALALCGCSAMLPMTDTLESSMSDEEVDRIAGITKLTPEQVRDPTIHEVHEVELSFAQMLDECYGGVPLYLKLLGALPLACTKIIIQPWNEKVAIIYHGWYTDRWTMAHEREHAKGAMHPYW